MGDTFLAEGASISKPPRFNGDTDKELVSITQKLRRMLKKSSKYQRKRSGDQANSERKKSKEVICYKCNKPGHIKSECLEKKKDKFTKVQDVKKKKSMMATWEDLDSSTCSYSSDSESESELTHKSNMCLITFDSGNISSSDSEQEEYEVLSEHDLLLSAYNEMLEDMQTLIEKCKFYKKKLADTEKKMALLEKDKTNLDSEVKDLRKKCSEKDFEISFHQSEVKRLTSKISKNENTLSLNAILSAQQFGKEGLGYKSQSNLSKGKAVIIDNSPPLLDLKQKMRKEMNSRFVSSSNNFHYERIHNRTEPSSYYVHASKVTNVKSNHAWMYANNRNRTKKSSTFYYKSVPTNVKGPKKIWVPKNLIIPATDVLYRRVQLTGTIARSWMLAVHDGEQVYVPRSHYF